MKVLVTGSEGYIGIMLCQVLQEQGFEVIGLDTGFYRSGWLYNSGFSKFPVSFNKDTRKIKSTDLQNIEAVVHLGELSNDPLGKLNPKNTFSINHQASVRLAKLAKKAGVKRFIYSSSCSVYGAGSSEYLTENSELNPQTAYAECKVLVEKDISKLADKNFSPTFLRNATAFGPSPRMRFDIVLNNLAGLAWTTKEIKMISDGSPLRPLVHILDICQAITCALKAPREIIHNQVFNVGDTSQNYSIKEIAEIVSEVFPNCKTSFGKNDEDNRSYRVSFDKISNKLPGFKCKRNAKHGAQELLSLFKSIKLDNNIFENRAYTRLKQLEYLIKTKQLNSQLFWNKYEK